MKKIYALICIAVLCLTMAACTIGKGKPTGHETISPSDMTQEEFEAQQKEFREESN